MANERRKLLEVRRDELSGDSELAALQTELALARQQYSDDHPDVKRLRRNITVLESAEASGNVDPELLRVRTQLTAVDEEIRAYRSRDAELRKEIAKLEDKQVMAPEIEKQLQVLNREYQLATSEYEKIRRKHADAQIASNLEHEDKGEKYSVIRQPTVPGSPVYPNRLGIMLIGLLFAFGGSAALISLRENFDSTVRGTHDISAALEGPPIAAIPIILNSSDAHARAWKVLRHATALTVVVISTFGLIVFWS